MQLTGTFSANTLKKSGQNNILDGFFFPLETISATPVITVALHLCYCKKQQYLLRNGVVFSKDMSTKCLTVVSVLNKKL